MPTVGSVTFSTTRHSHAQQRAWRTRHRNDEFHTNAAHWLSEGQWGDEGNWFTHVTNGLVFMVLNTWGLRKMVQSFSSSLTQTCKLNSWDPKPLQCPPPLIPESCLLLFLLLALRPHCDTHHCSSVGERDTRAEGALLLLVSFRVSLKPQPASGNTRNWDEAL